MPSKDRAVRQNMFLKAHACKKHSWATILLLTLKYILSLFYVKIVYEFGRVCAAT